MNMGTHSPTPPERRLAWVAPVIVGITVGITALAVGFGIGLSRSEAVASPPTQTMTASPNVRTVTETETQYRTPPACTQAFALMQKRASVASQGIDLAAKYPPLVGRAAEAGYDVDTDALKTIIFDQLWDGQRHGRFGSAPT
jgi:hypothetical protein